MTVRHLATQASHLAFAATALACFAAPAAARSPDDKRLDVTPYIGIDQTVIGPLKGGGDVLTFTNLTAGLTAEVDNRRVEATIDLEYNHSFSWAKDKAPDQDVLSGVGHANFKVARGLSLETGGIATRVRTDGLTGAQALDSSRYTSQVYAGYVGPSYVTKAGDLDVSASYRLGYARVDDSTDSNLAGGSFADSWSHTVTGSVGFAAGTVLPVGLTASAGYDREDASQLDQRFADRWGRVDATLPITPTVAAIGGIGYEKIDIKQRSPKLDASGVPLVVNGRYVTDKDSPRALVYDTDEVIWDAGVLWRPSHRTSLTAQAGHRYGGMTYSGSFIWQGRGSSFGVMVFDGIDSFGRILTADVAALSGSNLNAARNPFTNDLTGCAFSTTGGGRCFNDALTGITAANFRYRGVAAQYSASYGPWGFGVGAGYSQRKFITPPSELVLISGSKDQNWYGNGSVNYKFNDRDELNTVIYASYFDASGNRPDTFNAGASTSFYKSVTRRLSASASVGVDGTKSDDFDTVISALGQLGLRYSF